MIMSNSVLCRLCLAFKNDCRNIFSVRFGDDPAFKFIKEIFQLEVNHGEKLTMMCSRCNSKLRNFHAFYKMVKDAQQKYEYTFESYEADIKSEKSPAANPALAVKNELTDCHVKHEGADSKDIDFSDPLQSPHQDFDSNDCDYMPDKCDQIPDACDHIPEKDLSNDFQNESLNQVESAVQQIEKDINVDKITDTTNPSLNTKIQLLNIKEKRLAAKSRHLRATESFLSKYTLEKVYEEGKWLFSDKEKEEIISSFLDMKCNFADCTSTTSFENISDLEQHCVSLHESNFKWECCEIIYLKRALLEEHILKRHILKNRRIINILVPCSICNKPIRKLTMKYHLLLHLPHHKREVQCGECGVGFANKSQLATHLNTLHSNLSLPCEDCGKIYKNKRALHAHKVRHKAGDNHLCPECGKSIRDITNYKVHLQKHFEQDSKVKCEICGKVVTKMYLRRHNKYAHSTEMMKQCPHCPYKTQYFGLINHIKRVHEKIKPHSCSLCPMKFSTKKALGDHVSSRHTGIPRYNCPFCDKTFMCSGNYFTHQKRMHPKELAEKKLQLAGDLDNVLVGKVVNKKNKIKILEGEDSVELESSLRKSKKKDDSSLS